MQHALVLAHGGTAGLIVELSIVIGGLVLLAFAVWQHVRRKFDEYEVEKER